MDKMEPYQSPQVAAAFEAFAPQTREALLALRAAIFEAAGEIAQVEGIEESLKWGQPSYATRPKTGTPIRLAEHGGAPALFVHCQTTLVGDLASDNPSGLKTVDNRAVILPPEPDVALRSFIRAALTYHLRG